MAEITMLPKSYATLDEKQAEQMLRLIEALEEHDDVQNVYTNFDVPDEVIAKVAK
jgi:transcriptional/translational regulatory protein YebC/TACO1